MLTIEFHGFQPDSSNVKKRVREILEEHCPGVNRDARTEIVPSICEDREGKFCPYIRIVSDKMESEGVVHIIENELHYEVQWILQAHLL